MISDVFGLNTVYERQTERTWTEDPNFGYFVGGESGSGDLSRIDRFDVSTETPSVISPLTRTRSRNDALSSNFYGYTAGDPASCTIERLDFSSDVSQLSTNSIPTDYGLGASVSNNSYGYFSGGDRSARSCLIDRLEFSNDTVSRPASALPFVRRYHYGTENDSYGYFGGGQQPGTTCVITRLDFSNDNVSNPGNNLPQGVVQHATASSNTYGYYVSGSGTDIRKLDFSTEVSSISTPFVKQNDKFASFSTNKYGYFGGGQGLFSDVDRLDFSNDTSTSLGAPSNFLPPSTSGARDFLAAFSSGKAGRSIKHLRKTSGTDVDGRPISSTYGYFGAGWIYTNFDRLDFSTETTSLTDSSFATPLTYGRASIYNSFYGYFLGGNISQPTRTSRIDRFDFSTGTIEDITPSVGLSPVRSLSRGFSNSIYGYVGGGLVPGSTRIDNIDRFEFSTETIDSPGSYQLSQARNAPATVSTPQYGYFGGGQTTPARVNTVDRLDFSSETMLVTDSLPAIAGGLASIDDSSYGYFGGGTDGTFLTTIQRLDFSNETTETPGSYTLSQGRNLLVGVSNSYYGYFAGGADSPVATSTMDRFEFSSETSTTTNPLQFDRHFLAAVSN